MMENLIIWWIQDTRSMIIWKNSGCLVKGSCLYPLTTGTCPWNISISTSTMAFLTPSQELLLDQDLGLQDQLLCLPVLCVLSTAPLLVHQALGLHRTDMVHPHHLFTLPLHLTNLHIPSLSLIAFLILSQSLISDCTRINYYKRKLN